MLKRSIFTIIIGFIALQAFAQLIPVMNPILGPSNVCSLPSAGSTYSCSAINSPISYQWSVMSPSAGIIIANPNASVSLITFPNTNLTYTLVCTASNAAGTSSPALLIVKVYEMPTVTFSGAQSFCQGSSTNLSASPTIISASSSLSYTWSPGSSLNTTNSLNVVANPNTTTTYSLFLSIATCTNLATITVTVNPPPSFTPVISNTVFCKLATETLSIFGNASSYSISNVLTPSLSTLNYSVSGGVLITVTGESPFGCQTSASITFSVANCTVGLDDKQNLNESIFIYPNPSSGKFTIKNLPLHRQIIVQNEWGQLIRSFANENNSEILVEQLKPGIYFIKIDNLNLKVIVN
ncbi:MAG: T9SS type A sorting domain-containing protein [Bacteroidota bacterium]